MRVCAITGAGGSARFCAGLVRVIDPAELTVVVNTGDDERMRGLHVAPDIDGVLYHLADSADWDRFWGLADESFVAHERYRSLVARLDVPDVDLQEWFALGDRDLATHMLRTRLLDLGRTLAEATDAVRRALGVASKVLPMSNARVPTKITTAKGERLDFQEYFVRRQQSDEIVGVSYEGAERAEPAPGVVDAIAQADVFVIPPSNPILSIGPILAVPGVRDAIGRAKGTRVAISPIIGERAVKGPADRVLASLGHEVSPVGVAKVYEGLIDLFAMDATDAHRANEIEALGLRTVVCDTIMTGPDKAAELAKVVLDHAG